MKRKKKEEMKENFETVEDRCYETAIICLQEHLLTVILPHSIHNGIV